MKRWRIWTLLALLLCVPILLSHSSSPTLLQDSDTAYLLKIVRERKAPLSWFTGDWPLHNHFYRPLPTLAFELDDAISGSNPSGYGWTNAILCALCVLALYWFLAELSGSPSWALAGAALFTVWTLGHGDLPATVCFWAAGVMLLVGLYRHSFKLGRFLPASLALIFLGHEFQTPEMSLSGGLGDFMIRWLPGRTASVMTLFALLATAAYCRYERARGLRVPIPPPTPLDKPTGRRSVTLEKPALAGLWLALSILATAAAFRELRASRDGAGCTSRRRGRPEAIGDKAELGNPPRVLGGARRLSPAATPGSAPGISGYQAQQLRHGAGVWSDLSSYLLPNFPISDPSGCPFRKALSC